MQVKVENVDKNVIQLEIEVDAEKFEQGLQKSFLKNSGKFNIPGFRRGKAPRYIVEKFYGEQTLYEDAINDHIDKIMALDLVDVPAIKKAHFSIAVDCVNSTGGIALPLLLKKLGVTKVKVLNGEVNGVFAHNPEPLPEHLHQIAELIKKGNFHVGFVVDPDVDRLAIITEDGNMFGEEYTLVAVADHVFRNFEIIDAANPGKYKKAAVSNLSSSRALRDVAESYGGQYGAAAVGEVNVVARMRELKAVIGGEGNGGVIFPELHCGRDALAGIALFLSALVKSGLAMSEYRKTFPAYFMVKDRLDLAAGLNIPELLNKIKEAYADEIITDIDGVKIDWADSWVHLRASNTEPIIRIYAEAKTLDIAAQKVAAIKAEISDKH